MKLLLLGLATVVFAGCSTTYQKELLDKYPQHWWSSKYHQGQDTNYDRGEAWLETDKPDNQPQFFQTYHLPITPNVVYAYPGRYLYIKRGNSWHHYKIDEDFHDIDHLGSTDYVQMFSWGNGKTVVGGVKADGSMDLLSTFNGKLIANLKDVDTKDQPAKAKHATFVKMKDGTYRAVRAKRKAWNSWAYYPTQYEVLPYTYYFGGDIQYITLGVREVDGLGHTDIFFKEDFYDLSKNLEHSTQVVNKKHMGEYYKNKEIFNFGEHPEKRFVILRDGEITPPEQAALNSPKLKELIWMSEDKGKARALGIIIPNAKGQPRIHSLQIADYRGEEVRSPASGTLIRSAEGVKDATASYFITTHDYQELPSIIGKTENDLWGANAGSVDQFMNKVTGFSGFNPKGSVASKQENAALVRASCASAKMTPEQLAKARADYEEQDYNMAISAKEAYAQAVRQDEYKRKMSAYLAQEQARQEYREAMNSITNSLTKGATSNAPQAPRGFEDRYDSTGAGWNRYQKWVEKEAVRKARQK